MSLTRYALAAFLLIGGSALAQTPDLVIPAAAATDGARDTRWISDVILHNAGTSEVPVTLSFHDASGQNGQADAIVPPRSTLILRNVVGSIFGLDDATGAVLIDTDDFLAQKLVVTSRTYNLDTENEGSGEFGQDIPAMRPGGALTPGDTGVLTGPANAGTTRFNFGLYAPEDTTILWRLIRSTGVVAGEATRSYTAGTHTQHNNGLAALFDAAGQNGDVVHAVMQDGSAYVYGSVINNVTGDPSFVPAIPVRENEPVVILGVDIDEDGSTDIFDADGNGVLDAALDVPTGVFPSYFRVIAEDPEGGELTFSLVNPPVDVAIIDDLGTIQWYPGNNLKGTSGSLTVRVSDGTDSSDLIIPVNFR